MTPMGTLLTSMGEVVTACVGYIGDVTGAVVAQPVLLIPIGLGFLGVAVGLVKKFM